MTVGSAAFLTGPAPAALQPFFPVAGTPVPLAPVPLAHDWPTGRILVVGPQAVVALDLQRILRDAGYRVVGPAATVAEARRLIDRGPIDGAIVDLDIDRRTVPAILGLLDDAGIPAVFLSGAALEELPDRHRHGPLLDKPCKGPRLLAALRQALSPARNEDQGEGGFLYPLSPPPMPWPRVFPQL
jgi:CheY-like chemotaxis protein